MKKPIEFFMPKSEKESGKNDGDEAGAGTGGICICKECGYAMPHKTDQPCNEADCPQCGSKMTRKAAGDNTLIEKHPDPDWMHSLPGYQDEVAIHEELAEKYAKEDKGEV